MRVAWAVPVPEKSVFPFGSNKVKRSVAVQASPDSLRLITCWSFNVPINSPVCTE